MRLGAGWAGVVVAAAGGGVGIVVEVGRVVVAICRVSGSPRVLVRDCPAEAWLCAGFFDHGACWHWWAIRRRIVRARWMVRTANEYWR